MQRIGESVNLSCSAGGTPLPKTQWIKDGRRVKSTAEHHGNGLIRSELVIHQFKPNDAGNFTCLFYNDKNATAEASTVLGKYIKYLNRKYDIYTNINGN